MKYSENLSKITYTTEIGNFEVSDLTSYFVAPVQKIDTAITDVSSNSTLIELSYKIYSDINNFWYFLYANNTINPFTLFDVDSSDLIDQYTTNIQINSITLGGLDIITPEGSILLPYTENSGSTWEIGSTGNFSLTGGFGYITNFNSFTKVATIVKSSDSLNFTSNQTVNYIIKGSTYSYQGSFLGNTLSINYIQTQKDSIKEIKYKDNTNLQIYAMLDEDLPPVSKGTNLGFTGTSESISFETYAKTKETNIKYFVPYGIAAFQFNKIVQNYIV